MQRDSFFFWMISNPLMYCFSGHQTPLFYIPVHPCFILKDFSRNSKIDYFENGKIVKTVPRRSKRVKNIYIYINICSCKKLFHG